MNALKDVEGKKVATATFSSSNVIWPLILKSNGIDESKVTLLKVDPEALVPMLSSGQADAIISWTTSATTFVKELAKSRRKLKIMLWAEYGLEGYGYSLLASNKMLPSGQKLPVGSSELLCWACGWHWPILVTSPNR